MLLNGQALKIIQQTDTKGRRVPFQIAFVTAARDAWRQYKNARKNRDAFPQHSEEWIRHDTFMNSLNIGGEIIRHDHCTLSGDRGSHVKKNESKMIQNPGHWRNRTRNLVFHPSKQIRKIHIKLIMEVNNQPVLY